jgi:hypothetical protein
VGATASADSAYSVARAIAHEIGLSPDQLSQAHAQADTEHGLQAMYQYPQWVGDYQVFDANLTLLARRSDSAVFQVNSSLRPIDQAPPPGRIDRAQAQAIVLNYYQARGGQVAAPAVNAPVIYADRSPVELAWMFYVSISQPSITKLKVLVGATTEQVVYEAPAVIIN